MRWNLATLRAGLQRSLLFERLTPVDPFVGTPHLGASCRVRTMISYIRTSGFSLRKRTDNKPKTPASAACRLAAVFSQRRRRSSRSILPRFSWAYQAGCGEPIADTQQVGSQAVTQR